MGEARRRGKRDVLILCYHAVSEDWTSPLSVTPQALEAQMKFLVSQGYTGVTFTEAATEDHPGKVVAVTFDDAYDSVRELARPILDRYGDPKNDLCAEGGTWERVSQCPGPGSTSGSGGPREQELMPMSWESLRATAEAGWEIGSHTVSHPAPDHPR